MVSEKNNGRVPFILFFVITELILGGLGRLFYIPFRIAIFLVALSVSIIYIFKNRIVISKKVIIGIILLFLYCICGVTIGVFNGNSIGTSLKDITNFLSILYIIIFIVFIKYKKEILYKIIKMFRQYSLFIAIMTIILFLWSYIAKYIGINAIETLVNFQNITNYGLITGWLYDMNFARIYFANGIYMQIALAFSISDMLKYKEKKYYIEAVILILGILTSNTRGVLVRVTISNSNVFYFN